MSTGPFDTTAALNAALVHHREGRQAQAEQIYRQVLAINPLEPNALHLLGLLAYQNQRHTIAVELVEQAIRLAPQVPVFYNTLGVTLKELGRLDEAQQTLLRALELQPNNDEACFNLAQIFLLREQFAQAETLLRQAIAMRPGYALAWCSLGNALVRQGKFRESNDAYRRAVEVDPNLADGWNNLGNMLQQQGLLLEAVEAYDRALAIHPQHNSAADNRGTALCHLGRHAEAVASYRLAQALDAQPHPSSKLLLALNYAPHVDDATLFDEHRRFGTWLESRVKPLPPAPFDRDPSRRLRIGYVSGDFRDHAVACFVEAILTHHDRTQFEPIAYSDVFLADDVTAKFQSLMPIWRHCYGASDERLAQQVRQDKVDVLVDLSGHTSMGRLAAFAQRPAPLQITYLGYANTTGLSCIDALLTDAIVDPPGSERWYTESLVRLAPGFACYTAPAYAPAVSDAPCRQNGYVTIGLLHGLAKLNRAVLDLWCRVLRELPEARVLLYRHSLRGQTVDFLRTEFASRGIDAARLTIEPHPPEAATHLHVYARVDLTLDVFPWSGHTTACEALWMGVPIVTWRGSRHAGRMVSSVLQCLGRPEWIAETSDDYVRIAVELGRDRQRLAEIRSGLRPAMAGSPLCDGARFTRGFEAALRTLWQQRCMRP